MIKEAIQLLTDHKDLPFDLAQQSMREIITGEATPAQVGAFLVGLRMKGEKVDEITALALVMRQHAIRISPQVEGRIVDTCGTGGDVMKTFNVSTTAALVASGAGVRVAKHGNRSVTSKCGSADVLEAIGVNLNAQPATIQRAIEEIGIGFMFAPAFHPAMKNAVMPRKEIGIRTVFNMLGPLANPANANSQVLGVYEPSLVQPIAAVLQKLELKEAIVVHGLDGLDEISIIGKTKFAWLKDGRISTQEITPRNLNLDLATPDQIGALDVSESAKLLVRILSATEPRSSSRLQMVLANAAAAITVGGLADDLPSAVEIARESIMSGKAHAKLKQLVKFTDGDEAQLERIEEDNGKLS